MKFALVLVIGALIAGSAASSAWAAATITGADIVDGTIQSVDIGSKQVTNSDLATDAVTGDKIKQLSIKTGDYGDATVTSGKIKDATIQKHDLAPGVLPEGASRVIFGSCSIPVTHSAGGGPTIFGEVCPAPPFVDSSWNLIATMNEVSTVDMHIAKAWVQDPFDDEGGLTFQYVVNSEVDVDEPAVEVAYMIFK